MQPLILIPCKSFAAGKSRLAPVLSPERRDALCRSFLANTVNLAEQLAARGDIHIVSSDPDVAYVASDLGLPCAGEDDRDLNSALTACVAAIVARAENAERNILILPIDLALNNQAAIAPVLKARAEIVIVPDRLDQGTNLLHLAANIATRFAFQYGENSFARHRAEAQRLGLAVEIMRDPALCFDVDTPADYALWSGRAAATVQDPPKLPSAKR